MSISPFFQHLRSAYQAEINDLAFDSEGQDVLQRRLEDRRKELGFLLQMMELSPEMVAVVLHQGFEFKLPAAMDNLLSRESDELPSWDSLQHAIAQPKWAQDLCRVILQEPKGDWFLAVAAGLEFMYHSVDRHAAQNNESDDAQDEDHQDADRDGEKADAKNAESERPIDSDDANDYKSREEAGADWLAEQGFDRKD